MAAQFINIIINDSTECAFILQDVMKIGIFRAAIESAKKGAKPALYVPIDLELRHLIAFNKILQGKSLFPFIDMNSHFDVVIIIKFCAYLGIQTDNIAASFNGWTSAAKWVELWYPEYLYLIYIQAEELVDFKKYFRDAKAPFEALTRGIQAKDYINNPELFLNMIEFYRTYPLEKIYTENNAQTQEHLKGLIIQRNNLWQQFLINPYQPFISDYLKYSPIQDEVWSCVGISAVTKLAPGENTLAPQEVFTERFHEFTHGVFKKAPNPRYEGEFPFDNAIIAGGSVGKMIAHDFNKKIGRQSDVDIFIFGKSFEEKSRTFEAIMRWFNTPNTLYALQGSVTTIFIKNINRKFQVISNNHTNPFDIISHFDLTYIQWCYWHDSILGTPSALRALREKVARFSNTQRLRTKRLIKALYCGYDIIKDPEVLDKHDLDITELIADPNNDNLKRLIRELHSFFYPEEEPDMDPEEMKIYHLSMIEKDTTATHVTDDVDFVLNNMTIGGNFEDSYGSIIFSTFNINNVNQIPNGRRITKTLIKTRHGIMRLTSPIMEINDIVNNDAGMEIRLKVTDERFTEFIEQLEGPVYRLYCQHAVIRHILVDGKVKFTIPRYKLDLQTARGFSCLKSQRGVPLNVEEDLKAGDQLQLMFIMEVLCFPNDRAIDLKPIKLIKYCNIDPAAAIERAIEEAQLEEEINQIAKEIEFDENIIYGDTE